MNAPITQVFTPGRQAPTIEPQGPIVATPSSTRPLQSSRCLLQTSGIGPMPPLAA